MNKFFALLLTLCFVCGLAGPVRGGDVAVIMSSNADLYQGSLEGFRKTLRHRIVAEYDMKDSPERGRKALIESQSKINPKLIFTIGSPALRVAAVNTTSLPVVYSMVFNPSSIIGNTVKNVTGVSMNVSVKETVQLFKELSPKIRRVGVVFNPASSGYLVIQAMLVARKQGIELVSREIRSPKQVIQAVNSLKDKIDALWILPDETILSEEVFRYMLLFSYENKVPVLGLSERQTRMGALLSLSYGSSKDIGRQAGEMANRILSGIKPARTPYTTPRQVKLTVNQRAARNLGMEIPNSLLERADNAVKAPVYRDGDWWVFRIKIRELSSTQTEVHRVTFKNGKFASDDSSFLTGGNVAGTPEFLPFASVYVTDPQRKWLDFPLVPGKKWSFRYRRINFSRGATTATRGGAWGYARAEVIGKTSHPIETPAGKIEAIEVSRSDSLGPYARGKLTYYYSPQSQSVVKLRAGIISNVAGEYELELVAYGNGGNMGKDLR